jgi:excisionase family DNA binding protein
MKTDPQDEERLINAKEAARYLGVTPNTIYVWVEQKRIPHLRTMGYTIRFLKSELEPYRVRVPAAPHSAMEAEPTAEAAEKSDEQ